MMWQFGDHPRLSLHPLPHLQAPQAFLLLQASTRKQETQGSRSHLPHPHPLTHLPDCTLDRVKLLPRATKAAQSHPNPEIRRKEILELKKFPAGISKSSCLPVFGFHSSAWAQLRPTFQQRKRRNGHPRFQVSWVVYQQVCTPSSSAS